MLLVALTGPSGRRLNKKAIAGSTEYRALACTHSTHVQMSGRDASGVWHGEHAERYTAKWCSILDRIHELAWAGNDGLATVSSSSSSSGGSDDEGSSGDTGSASASDGSGGDSDSSGSGTGSSTNSDEAAGETQPRKQQRQSQQQQSQQQQLRFCTGTAVASAPASQASVARSKVPLELSKIVVRHH